jgi:thymidylate synthase ThyX
VLPAASLSNVGIFGSGQGYEQLLLRMRAHPLPEARAYAQLMLTELRKVIPSFLRRVDVPDRGVEWSEYLAATREDTARVVERLFPQGVGLEPDGPEVRLVDFDPAGEDKVLAAACFAHVGGSEAAVMARVRELGLAERTALLEAYVGERQNRRHRPGRAFERTDYRFELVTDYGAFRDLQRHRLCTVEWQPLGCSLGADVPAAVAEAGCSALHSESLARSHALFDAIRAHHPDEAGYAVALAYRIRYILQLNAREAMHLTELRSGPQGHPAYRRVAQEMHRQIAAVAGHHALAAAMRHVDHSDPDLERLEGERRAEARRATREGGSSEPVAADSSDL